MLGIDADDPGKCLVPHPPYMINAKALDARSRYIPPCTLFRPILFFFFTVLPWPRWIAKLELLAFEPAW
jgi:hypothetical protein